MTALVLFYRFAFNCNINIRLKERCCDRLVFVKIKLLEEIYVQHTS